MENVEAAVLMMPVDSQDVSSVYVTVPDESTNNSSTFDATHLGISHRPREPDVPIPIFSSSQYFIKRSSRSEWYPQHQSVAGIKGQYRRQSLVNSTKGHHCDIAMRLCPMTSEKGKPTFCDWFLASCHRDVYLHHRNHSVNESTGLYLQVVETSRMPLKTASTRCLNVKDSIEATMHD